MQKGVEKASDMMNTLNEKFATDEAKNIGNNQSI